MSTVEISDASLRSRQIGIRLKFFFASLTCLGGLVLTSGIENPSIPLLAVFFAIFGFVFVDWLELFALPPIAAYAAMAVAALYCVSDFLEMDAPGNHQMIVVSQLLVLVQAILMLQRKNRRIFEQLVIFCLLQLIVAAVFNDALMYGLLLIPIGIIGAWALSLLAALSTSEGLTTDEALGMEIFAAKSNSPSHSGRITVSSSESWESLSRWALRLPRVALAILTPAILLIAAVFFYAIPRTNDAARIQNRGNALVGFSDELRLEQIGQMMQSTQTALRIYLSDSRTGAAYSMVGGLYLRGKVLELYRTRQSDGRNTALWNSIPIGMVSSPQQLPIEYLPRRRSDENFYDSVQATVICESMRSNALFSVAPYHQIRPEPEIIHLAELWTLARIGSDDWVFPRIEYRFGTHALKSGIQTDLIAYRDEGLSATGGLTRRRMGAGFRKQEEVADERLQQSYIESLLAFDIDAMPTVAELASKFVYTGSGRRRSDYEIAKAMERHLAADPRYSYTLNLDRDSIPGLDPIEQFLKVDRQGHCQYFASALAMMLRSEGIPSRIVVGYHTDEFNELGSHYVARQLHAHSWVEALIDRDQLGREPAIFGQEPAEKYWLRLDPTPPFGRLRPSGGGVGQVLDMAKNVWDDYVVDMDADRQPIALIGGSANPMNRSYQQFIDRLGIIIGRIRAGELGGGALASGKLFSLPAAAIGAAAVMLGVLLLRLRLPAWWGRKHRGEKTAATAEPSIAFYAQALRQLQRLGLTRESSQTPVELSRLAVDRLVSSSPQPPVQALHYLTGAFYQARYGSDGAANGLELSGELTHAQRRDDDPDPVRVEVALAELTRGIDSVLRQRVNSEF